MENKTLTFISTHIINKAVVSEYKKMNNIAGYDCILVIDNSNLQIEFDTRITEKEFFGEKIKCFFFDEELHKELNLPYITYDKLNAKYSEVMWYNADYRYYYVKKYFPNYDYYWQFEYDVFMNGNSYESFLTGYDNDDADLLIVGLRDENICSDWYWIHGVDWCYQDDSLKGSFFPVCRLSNRAIDTLYNARLKLADIYKNLSDRKNAQWPFCELLVPTELANNGFKCKNIEIHHIALNEYDLNEDRLFENPDNLLYHPVKGRFLERLKNLRNENCKLKKKQKIRINLLGIKITFNSNKFIKIV